MQTYCVDEEIKAKVLVPGDKSTPVKPVDPTKDRTPNRIIIKKNENNFKVKNYKIGPGQTCVILLANTVADFTSEAYVYVHAPETNIYFRRSVMPKFDKNKLNTGIGPRSIFYETENIEIQQYINLTNQDFSYLYVFNNATADERFSLRYKSSNPLDLENLLPPIENKALIGLVSGALAATALILF